MSNKPQLIQDGTPVTIVCPDCIPPIQLIVLTYKPSNTQYLACQNWPQCAHTQDIPPDIAMRAQGATPLPGLELAQEKGDQPHDP
jgi:ssDNA-binding Zn-finger/Zn-ribbon topoisomerase 1